MPIDGYGQNFDTPDDRASSSNPLLDPYAQRTPSTYGQTGDTTLAAAERAATRSFAEALSTGVTENILGAAEDMAAAIRGRAEGALSEESARKQPPLMSTTAIPQRQKQELQIARQSVVRRPGSGMAQLKGVTRISLQARGAGGELLPILNSTYEGGKGIESTNFMIVETRYTHNAPLRQEVTQNAVYLVAKGVTLPTVSISGILFQSRNFPWFSEFMANYHNYLAGDQAIRNGAVARIETGGRVYVGYIGNVTASQRAREASAIVPFSFDMIVVEENDAPAVRRFTQDGQPLQTGSIIDEYIELFREQGLSNKIADSSARAVFRGEILEGTLDGIGAVGAQSLPEAGTEETPFRFDLNQAIAGALTVNANAGRTVFDINSIRRGYLRSMSQTVLAASRPRPANSPTDRTYEVISDEIEGARSAEWADRVTGRGIDSGVQDPNAYYGIR